MTDLRKAAEMALVALEEINYRIERDLEHDHEWAVVERELGNEAITALRQALAQPKQEPFCFHDGRNIVDKEFADHSDVFPLYTVPSLRQWQGLTEEDLFDIANVNFGEPDMTLFIEMGRLVQKELKEKNT